MVTYFPKPLNNQVAAISDSLTRTQEGLGIGASGDTHDAIGSGQFVYVRDHSSLAEGLYKSTAAIAANGALSTSNLTADGSGGLNDLQGQLTTLNSKIANKIKYIDTTVTGAINTLDNGVYILEEDMPNALPAGSVVITVEVKAATIFASINATTNKLYLYCMAQKSTSATYNIRVFYYLP